MCAIRYTTIESSICIRNLVHLVTAPFQCIRLGAETNLKHKMLGR
jgi:hypothetical protein